MPRGKQGRVPGQPAPCKGGDVRPRRDPAAKPACGRPACRKAPCGSERHHRPPGPAPEPRSDLVRTPLTPAGPTWGTDRRGPAWADRRGKNRPAWPHWAALARRARCEGRRPAAVCRRALSKRVRGRFSNRRASTSRGLGCTASALSQLTIDGLTRPIPPRRRPESGAARRPGPGPRLRCGDHGGTMIAPSTGNDQSIEDQKVDSGPGGNAATEGCAP